MTTRRGTTKAAIAAVLAAAALAGSPAGAAAPPREAEFVRTLTTRVVAGDPMFLACGRNAGPTGLGSVFASFSIMDDAGRRYGGPTVVASMWQDEYIDYRIAGRSGRIELAANPDAGQFAQGAPFTAPASGVVTATWARFGSDMECRLLVNDVEVSGWRDDEAARGVYALNTDFEGAASLGGQRCAGSCAGAMVAAGITYTRPSSGLLFAALVPYVGAAVAEGPAGERYSSNIGVAFSQATGGTWRYRIDAQAAPIVAPVLWIVEIPV